MTTTDVSQPVIRTQTQTSLSIIQDRAESHHYLAERIARRLKPRLDWVELDDIKGAARLGLMQAAHKYSPLAGKSFAAYARKYIIGAIYHSKEVRRVRPEVWKHVKAYKIAHREIRDELGRMPTIGEIAFRAKITKRQATIAKNIDAVIFADSDIEEIEMLAAPFESEESRADQNAALNWALDQISPADRNVFEKTYKDGLSSKAVASLAGKSDGAVRIQNLRTKAQLGALIIDFMKRNSAMLLLVFAAFAVFSLVSPRLTPGTLARPQLDYLKIGGPRSELARLTISPSQLRPEPVVADTGGGHTLQTGIPISEQKVAAPGVVLLPDTSELVPKSPTPVWSADIPEANETLHVVSTSVTRFTVFFKEIGVELTDNGISSGGHITTTFGAGGSGGPDSDAASFFTQYVEPSTSGCITFTVPSVESEKIAGINWNWAGVSNDSYALNASATDAPMVTLSLMPPFVHRPVLFSEDVGSITHATFIYDETSGVMAQRGELVINVERFSGTLDADHSFVPAPAALSGNYQAPSIVLADPGNPQTFRAACFIPIAPILFASVQPGTITITNSNGITRPGDYLYPADALSVAAVTAAPSGNRRSVTLILVDPNNPPPLGTACFTPTATVLFVSVKPGEIVITNGSGITRPGENLYIDHALSVAATTAPSDNQRTVTPVLVDPRNPEHVSSVRLTSAVRPHVESINKDLVVTAAPDPLDTYQDRRRLLRDMGPNGDDGTDVDNAKPHSKPSILVCSTALVWPRRKRAKNSRRDMDFDAEEHLSEDTLMRYVDNDLGVLERVAIDKHLQTCLRCTARLDFVHYVQTVIDEELAVTEPTRD